MKVLDDIYLVGDGEIRLSHPADCHVYLLDGGGEAVLIDAGVGLEPELILENIRRDGFQPGDVGSLIVTHSHADHAGGASWFRSKLSCRVIAPELEERIIGAGSDEDLGLDVAKRSGIYPQDYVFRHCEVDGVLKDAERMKVGRYELTMIQVPGHSPGTGCILVDGGDGRMLFSSDVVFLGGTIGLGNWEGNSLREYRRSIGKLANLSVEALFPGHYLWTLRGGQEHLDKAVENLRQAWVPPAWQHNHPHR